MRNFAALMLSFMFSLAILLFVCFVPAPPSFAQETIEQAQTDTPQTDDIPNTQKLEIPFTPAAKALKMLKLPEGFSASLFANEPDVIQPIAATTDSRGRLWIVECLTYSDRKQNYDLALHDRVIILEDTDNDGHHDKRTVFWDKGQKLTGIELGFGGVWLTAAPNLLFIPDADGDDKPDGEPQVILDGFNGDEIRHNVVNGLRWGPDGWLYGRHGIQATSHVGPPGASNSQRVPMNCAIWRIHPQTKRFEIVAEGGTNPWGFDYDEHGEMFMINTVIGHMFHIVPGARYRRMYGAHFNQHTYRVIEQTADHFHWDRSEEHWAVTKKEGMSDGTDAAGGGHAHTGLMCYQGGNWPKQYHNKWMTANFHGRRINVDRTERDGNGYTARHEPDMIKSEDPWFRGVEMIYGPDGGVYLLDWSDIGECHENDGIHRTSGRIFKIIYGTPERPNDLDLSKWTNQQLVDCNTMENQWFVRHARRILQERSIKNGGLDLGEKLLAFCEQQMSPENLKGERDVRPLLRAIWAMHSAGWADEKFLLKQTHDENEHVRAWAVRLLDDRREREFSKSVKARFTELAKDDPSGLVRLYLASSLHRFDIEKDQAIFYHLVSHKSDANDRTQPHLLWNKIEPQVMSNTKIAQAIGGSSFIPTIRENIARRIASEAETHPKAFESLMFEVGSTHHANRLVTLRGILKAFEGRSSVPKPKNWERVFDSIMTPESVTGLWSEPSEEMKKELRRLNVLFGDGRAIEELKTIAADNESSVEARRNAILEYAATKPEGLFEFLKPMISNKALSNAVIQGLVYTDKPQAANVIVNRYGNLDPEGKTLAINVLTMRKPWSKKLLQAIKNKKIDKTSLLAQHARQIRGFDEEELTRLLTQVWGSIRDTEKSRLAEMNQIKKIYESRPAWTESETQKHREAGQKLFTEKCASCHVIYGRGANVGPDLTGGDRKNLNYLLENIIDPNASVADTYRASVFLLNDGRLLTGVVLQKTDRTTKIQTATETLTLDNNDIESSKKTELSLMPDGLLENMTDEQITDLFSFLSEK